jgi:5-methylcytosine-specific restriction enzyme subunit McrC
MTLVIEDCQKPAKNDPGYIGKIPVRNLWLLMLYASDLFRLLHIRGKNSVELEENQDEIPDLVAEILTNAVSLRLRHQLSLGYRSQDAWLTRVRGRINLMSTERHQLLKRGLIACRYENLTIDTPRNRFVRVALESISRLVKDKDITHRCRLLASCLKMAGVSGKAPTLVQMNNERFGRHDMDDRYMVAAAKLAFELMLPTETETAGGSVLPLPDRDEKWVRQLYERAVGGFYKVVLPLEGWTVECGKSQKWREENQTDGMRKILPSMITDIVLLNRPQKIKLVIDTKFTSILIKNQYKEDKLKNPNIYQMYAYLRTQEGGGDTLADAATASGLLLYPAIGEMVDESAVFQGHRIRFATVDLTATPTEIRERLLYLVKT